MFPGKRLRAGSKAGASSGGKQWAGHRVLGSGEAYTAALAFLRAGFVFSAEKQTSRGNS